MKLSEHLRAQIISNVIAETTFTPKLQKPEHPTSQEIYDAIVASKQYCETNAAKRHKLQQTQEIYSSINGDTIRLPLSVPLLKRGKIHMTSDLAIEGDDCVMNLKPGGNSSYVLYANEMRAIRQQHETNLRREYREYDSLQQLIAYAPNVSKQQIVIDALAHEKRLRQEAAARRKNPEPIVPIETQAGTSTAIAKARLLGAQFFND